MNIPDYVSPIVGYRTWQWDALGLKSLNHEQWLPGQALEAACKPSDLAAVLAKFRNQHDPPHEGCTCGIYAAKNYDHFCDIGYMRRGEVHGEVCLWGRVWEHNLGYRAQYAYPKNIILPPDIFKTDGVESLLEPLIAYGVDILVVPPPPDLAMVPVVIPQDIPLWSKEAGFIQAGLDWLVERRRQWHLYCEQKRTLKVGDSVAILNRGICRPVDNLDGDRVYLRIWAKRLLNIPRNGVVWNPQNWRWESDGTDCRVIVL